jgi:sarcosine oxidase
VTKYDADVVVVGLGALGSMTLWRLAARGIDVLGIEQFDIAHDRGSSFGSTRLFRTACFEHPDLGTMALRARDLWRELEDQSQTELLTLTGGVMIGPRTSELIVGTREAARRAGTEVDELSWEEVTARFPVHASTPESYVGLWDPGAGVVRPEASITAAVTVAKALGARVLTNTRVTTISEDSDGVEVHLDDRTIRARSVVVAAGPWVSKLLGEPSLVPIRLIMTWFKAREGVLDTTHMPVFIRHFDDDHTFWGHGQIDGLHIKVGAPDDPTNFSVTDPDIIDREVSDTDISVARDVVGRYLDGVDPEPVLAKVCMITDSPDRQFVLGPREPGSRVIIASGDSGHAYKHSSAIGEFLAGAALGQAPSDEHRFASPNRFQTTA